MDELNLVEVAQQLLTIYMDFPFRLKNPMQSTIADFELETFTQTWGNTSCGFEGIGGDAISSQRTYVFIPITADENCFVYFGGRFGYEVPYSQCFINDVVERKIVGVKHKGKYLIK